MLKDRIRPGVYSTRSGGMAEIWGRDASGNPLYPFYGNLPESPEDDAWSDTGKNLARADFDLVCRVGHLTQVAIATLPVPISGLSDAERDAIMEVIGVAEDLSLRGDDRAAVALGWMRSLLSSG